MDKALKKLLSIASPPLFSNEEEIAAESLSAAGHLSAGLAELLSNRNGFLAFEGALHVLPARSVPGSYGLDEWNAPSLWRHEYDDLANRCYFFAEDIFGGQFCVRNDQVMTFDPETGRLDPMTKDLEGWANAVLSDYEVLTGHRLAHDWQVKYGALVGRQRLVPKIPFVCGGKYALSNLVAVDAAEGMRSRGNLARQIRDLPDGAQIKWV